MTERYKVRIALAIDGTGEWSAGGYGNVREPIGDPWKKFDYVCDALNEGERRYIIETWVEPPILLDAETVLVPAQEIAPAPGEAEEAGRG